MKVGREALEFTNPGARYIVLTDKETAPALEKDFEVEVLAPSGEPLMRQYMLAQLAYEKKAEDGLVVLAATDCAAVRDLSTSLQHNMAVTYRIMGKAMINNIAYVYDHDRAAWFLRRALDMMNPDFYEFWGDQESWQDALGPSEEWEPLNPDYPDRIRVAKPDGCWIHLYPCRTHNYFVKRSGAFSNIARRAYLVHFKGNRKLMMVESVCWNILGRAPQGEAFPNWKQARENSLVLPMEERRARVIKQLKKKRGVGGECGSFLLDQDTGEKN